MRIFANAVGFTEGRIIHLAEGLIVGGAVVAGIGVAMVGAGWLIMRKGSTWFVSGVEKDEYIMGLLKNFDEAWKSVGC